MNLVRKNDQYYDFDVLLSLLFDCKTFIRYCSFQAFELRHFFCVNEHEVDEKNLLEIVVQKDTSKQSSPAHMATSLRYIHLLICVQFWLAYVLLQIYSTFGKKCIFTRNSTRKKAGG